jgi:hypothetical protein
MPVAAADCACVDYLEPEQGARAFPSVIDMPRGLRQSRGFDNSRRFGNTRRPWRPAQHSRAARLRRKGTPDAGQHGRH